jgi:hypothetical protein
VTRLRWLLAAVALVAYDVYLLGWRLSDVQGNVEAQFIIVTPMFIAQHLLMKRHVDLRHAETRARLDAQDEAMAETHRKVGELHRLHVEGRVPLPKRIVRD